MEGRRRTGGAADSLMGKMQKRGEGSARRSRTDAAFGGGGTEACRRKAPLAMGRKIRGPEELS